MDKEVIKLSEFSGALASLANKQKEIEKNPQRNQRDSSSEGFRMQIIGPGTDVERLHTELGIPQTVLCDLLNKFGFSQDSQLNIVFHQEKPGFIAFQSPEIDLKEPSTYISYTGDTDGSMVLGLEGIKEGVNLRGQYKMDPLEQIFKLTAWNCVDKLKAPGLDRYSGQTLPVSIPTHISMRPLRSM